MLTFEINFGGKKVYIKGVFSSENSSASTGKKRFGVYPKACFQGKKKENTYTPKRLQGVCERTLRAALVYRFWPPKIVACPHCGLQRRLCQASVDPSRTPKKARGDQDMACSTCPRPRIGLRGGARKAGGAVGRAGFGRGLWDGLMRDGREAPDWSRCP